MDWWLKVDKSCSELFQHTPVAVTPGFDFCAACRKSRPPFFAALVVGKDLNLQHQDYLGTKNTVQSLRPSIA